MADTRFVQLRDVLTRGLRDLALQVAQLDMSDPTPAEPTVECVEQWIQSVALELRAAAERGMVVPSSVAVYVPPTMVRAAVELSKQSMRLQYNAAGDSVLLAPPPPSYTLGTLSLEIERACAEATPTQELPTMDTLPTPADCPDCDYANVPNDGWSLCAEPGCPRKHWVRPCEKHRAEAKRTEPPKAEPEAVAEQSRELARVEAAFNSDVRFGAPHHQPCMCIECVAERSKVRPTYGVTCDDIKNPMPVQREDGAA